MWNMVLIVMVVNRKQISKKWTLGSLNEGKLPRMARGWMKRAVLGYRGEPLANDREGGIEWRYVARYTADMLFAAFT
jgi:hypothetical protein